MGDSITLKCTLSNTDVPCLWESGGESKDGDKGFSTIICNSNGNPKRAIFIQKNIPDLYGGNHALIPIKTGDIVIKTLHENKKFNISVYKIEDVKHDDVELKQEYSFSSETGNWDREIPKWLIEPIKISKHKSLTTDCRDPFYIKTR